MYMPLYKEHGFEICQDNFEDVQLPKLFDLILCSHTLYHVCTTIYFIFTDINGIEDNIVN